MENCSSWTLQFDLKDVLQPKRLRVLLEEFNSSIAEEKSYRTLMPVARKLVALYKEQRQLEEQKKPRIPCVLCKGDVFFRGWPAFMIHQEKYWKTYPHHHRGYFRALKEVRIAEGLEPDPAKQQIWPPVLIVDNSGPTFDGSLRRWRGLQGEDIPANLKDLKLEEVLAVYSQGNNPDEKSVIVFPPSEVGMIDARQLDLQLKRCEQVKVDWIRLPEKRSPEPASDTSNPVDNQCILEDPNRFECKEDDAYDDDYPASCSSECLAEYLDAKRAKKLMDRWSQSFQESNKLVGFTLPRPFRKSTELREMDSKFLRELKDLESRSPKNKQYIRIQLEEIEKRLKKERLAWLKEIDDVEEQLSITSLDLHKQRASEEFENDIIAMQKEKIAQRRHNAVKKNMDDLSCIYCNKTLRQLVQAEQRRLALIAAYQLEENCYRRQAELARDEKRHVQHICETRKFALSRYEMAELEKESLDDQSAGESCHCGTTGDKSCEVSVCC
ncbi:hypothetical protein O6H91_14G032600 [Diphasiastrum complanatum]|uniref:Uncharacterized protein n=1 Tax=Diphasiastrum complanatum TaxID=34168 RepID=A0ACC2BMW3_DIPCM|nr:hypothetical protein O6H91_Y176400 [Diphasiastrum complanatum]KAJ7531108.1 hypothetical protein O6H91_14G032600 [Diphasiastrum complanatum]